MTDDATSCGGVRAQRRAAPRRCRDEPADAILRAAADDARRARRPGARCWCSATAAARPTRSTSRPSWWGGSAVSGAALPVDGADGRRGDADGGRRTTSGIDAVFARQVEALGAAGRRGGGDHDERRVGERESRRCERRARPGADDRSRSPGATAARAGRLADVHVNVPDASPARVQEVHRTILHVMCELVEAGSLKV